MMRDHVCAGSLVKETPPSLMSRWRLQFSGGAFWRAAPLDQGLGEACPPGALNHTTEFLRPFVAVVLLSQERAL
jgi:hypothetical protein